jgi:hemerythrin superfamily protein
MATRNTAAKSSKSSKSTGTRGKAAGNADAVALLKADHKEVQELFDEYDQLIEDEEASPEERQQLAEQICAMLTVHAQIEEEIFYPAAREAVEEDLVNEATVEHASAKELIAQIQGMSPDEELYDAKVKVLGEYVRHHVKEEESEMFPQAKKGEVDLAALGEQLRERKEALMAEMGLAEVSDEG